MEQMNTTMKRFKKERDTKSAILEMKKFKVLCQAKSAELLNDTLTSDKAYKRQMEQMASDIKFYEEMCRGMIAGDLFLHQFSDIIDKFDDKEKTINDILMCCHYSNKGLSPAQQKIIVCDMDPRLVALLGWCGGRFNLSA